MNSISNTALADTDIEIFTEAPPVFEVEQPSRIRLLPWRKILTTAAALAVAGTAAASYLFYSARFESTDDSYLEGDIHPISARIDGTVVRVLVDDNQHVEAGQPLVELDPADLNLALQASEADFARARADNRQVQAQVARAQADVGAAAARIAQNEAEVRLAELDFQRTRTLVAVGAASRQALDDARTALDAARAVHQSLVASRTAAGAALAAARAQGAVSSAAVQKAVVAEKLARLQVGYTAVRAPAAGRVAKKTVEVGTRVQPGQPLLAVVSDRVWVVANFKESQLARLRPGEPAEVRVDALGGRKFAGVVDSVAPGTGAEFSLLPPDNATGNFTKIVQRVPVKIRFDAGAASDFGARLFPGLSATVTVGVAR